MNGINIGLEGIVVGETAISHVDGDNGELSYRGFPISELTGKTYIQVIWLLLFGDLPSGKQESELAHFLMTNSQLGDAERQLIEAVPDGTHPMLMLQGLVPLLSLETQDSLALPQDNPDALQGLIIAAKIPTLVAAYYRKEQGLDWPIASFSSDPIKGFLKSMHGDDPEEVKVEVLKMTQILQMEHSYNAGTFAGRVAISTQAPVASSISASIGTLFGKLHGGADQAALETAMEVGSPEAAEGYVKSLLNRSGRVMGIGHREYSTLDPRAKVLKPLARSVCLDPESENLLQTLEAIEATCIEQLEKPGKTLRANVEFYKGAVFHALGVPPRYFTALFAIARVYGYLAHALEFRPQARLIRPRAKYVGKMPDREL